MTSVDIHDANSTVVMSLLLLKILAFLEYDKSY